MGNSNIKYPKFEINLINTNNSILNDIYNYLKEANLPEGYTADDIVFDGFYPFYTQQRCKILFIGRESLSMSGENYIEKLHSYYKINKSIGDKPINQHGFHSLMFYITYGLNNNFCSWEDIPYASELAETFATDKGISFAFMNLSKLSNDTDNWEVDWNIVDSYINLFESSPVNFFSKQIEALDPDIILTMNLEDRLYALGDINVIEYGKCASYFTLKTSENEYFLIDLFHFSSTKPRKDCFYDPIIKGIMKFNPMKIK